MVGTAAAIATSGVVFKEEQNTGTAADEAVQPKVTESINTHKDVQPKVTESINTHSDTSARASGVAMPRIQITRITRHCIKLILNSYFLYIHTYIYIHVYMYIHICL